MPRRDDIIEPEDRDERIVRHEHDHMVHDDRDVVARDTGTGLGTVLGIILAIILALAVLWFLFGTNLVGPGPVAPPTGPGSPPSDDFAPPQPPGGNPGGLNPGSGNPGSGGGMDPGQ